MGPASGAADLFNGSTTARALGAVLTKDFQVVGEVTVFTTSVFEMLERCAANGDGFFHDVSGSGA